jgi:hypothetical protein
MKPHYRNGLILTGACACGICIAIASAMADAPQPGIAITALGTNTYQIMITNGWATTNYELYLTPVVGDTAYPWKLISRGALGQTNWTVDGAQNLTGYYSVWLGADADGDLSPNSEDADPFNPFLTQLTITIDSPTDHSTIQ